MKTFRIIPRLEIKDRNLIKGIRLEGLKKIGEYNMVAKLGNTYRLGKTHTTKSKEQISNKST
mgnify:CR=1 FL=1